MESPPPLDDGRAPTTEDSSAEAQRAAALKAAESLKKKPHQVSDPTKNITLNREKRQELETAALAEAFGVWLSDFTGRPVRGSEGLFEDLQDGVVLCLLLARLGIDVHRPRNPVRNAFEARENCQKFQAACRAAGFNSIPSVDADGPGLIPTLLEAAAVCNAQNLKLDKDQAAGALRGHVPRRASVVLPAALTKRLAEVRESKVIAAAQQGVVVGRTEEEEPPAVAVSWAEVAAAPIQAPPPAPAPPAPAPPALARASPSLTARKTSAEHSPLLVQRKRTESANSLPKERTRSASEIPPEEKDHMVNMCLAGFVLLLVVWWVFLR